MRRLLLTIAIALTGCAAPVAAPDAANATYRIEQTTVTLAAGKAEVPVAPGSSAKAVTTLGAQAPADLDGDGRADVAVVLVQQPGGSGTFTYVAVLLNPAAGAKATNAVLIGDRVVVQSLKVDGKTVVVEYLDRKPGEALAIAPSVASTKRLVIRDGVLGPA